MQSLCHCDQAPRPTRQSQPTKLVPGLNGDTLYEIRNTIVIIPHMSYLPAAAADSLKIINNQYRRSAVASCEEGNNSPQFYIFHSSFYILSAPPQKFNLFDNFAHYPDPIETGFKWLIRQRISWYIANKRRSRTSSKELVMFLF